MHLVLNIISFLYKNWYNFLKYNFCICIIIFWSFLKIYVLHGSVTTQLERGKIYNNRIIVDCLRSAPVKEI